MSAVILARNLDITNVSFVLGPKKTGRNPSVQIKYNGQPLMIRLPKMTYPGGVLERKDDKTGAVGYSLLGSLSGCDPYGVERADDTTDIGHLYNFLKDLKPLLIQAATENSQKWFGKKRTTEGIIDSLKDFMRLSADKLDGEYVPNGKYPPSLTLKVPVYEGKVNVDIIDDSNNPVYVSPSTLRNVFPKGVEAACAICPSVYIMAGGGLGMTMRVSHAKMLPSSRVRASDVFMDEEEEEILPPPLPEEGLERQEAKEAPEEEEVAPPPEEKKPERRRRTAQPVG